MTAVEPTLDELHDAQATAVEDAAAASVDGGWGVEVAAVVSSILAARATLAAAAGVAAAGTLPTAFAARLSAAAVAALDLLDPDVRPVLVATAGAGFGLGRSQARQVLAGDPALTDPPGEADRLDADADQPPDDDDLDDGLDDGDLLDGIDDDDDWPVDLDDDAITETVDTINDRLDVLLADARRLARTLPMATEADVTAVTAKATQAATVARRDAVWVAERSVAAGVAAETRQVAEDPTVDMQPGLLWIAERDGCLHCLALAGHVIAAGDLFPDVTFGDKPLGGRVPYPPRHPFCRCRVRPYTGPTASRDLSADDPASALAREARRSVLRGWSASDSETARLRAADRLVQAGADLPRSVVDRAVRNIREGRFSQRQRPRTTLTA